MISLIEAAISALILAGAFFTFVGALGVVRFPDVYNRAHAAGLPVSLGVGAILLAAALFFSGRGEGVFLKPLVAMGLILLTMPVGTHMIIRAAYAVGIRPPEGYRRDDLAGHLAAGQEHD